MKESTDKRKVQVAPPEVFTGLVISSPKDKAVGIPAILSSLKHAGRYMKPGHALGLSLKMNQKGGFDCPGCAWPDPDDKRSGLGEYCENGIKALAEEAQKELIDAAFFSKHSVGELSQLSDFELGKLGRLVEPLVLEKGSSHYESISWEQAFKLIANQLNMLDSPDEALFYTSGRTSNEAAYLYQLFVRTFGTNNLPDCSNMCHESSGVALSETVGIGKGSVTLEDLHQAEVIMVMGQNPGTNHPRMLSALERCKENGGSIISVNPLPEAGMVRYINPQSAKKILTGGETITDLFVPVTINGDIAFLKGIMICLLELETQHPGKVIDHAFIEEYTEGYQALVEDLSLLSLEQCAEASGINATLIRQAAEMMAFKDKIIICWAMGLTQHENGVANIKEVVNLLLMKGAIGKPGAGTCPVRGHSNVQGDRTMGIWEAPKEAFLDRLESEHGINAPRKHGLAVVPAIQAMKQKKAKFFFAMGGNFLSATPDTEFTAEALQQTCLTVQVSTKLNRSHLVTGKRALILPCLVRSEEDLQPAGKQFVSTENSMGIVQSSQGTKKPASEQLKSEVRIVAELAAATLSESGIDWIGYADNYDLIRESISRVIPGFEDYNLKVRKEGGFYLPNGARVRQFNTVSGKAQFSCNELPAHTRNPGEYIMMTIRSHDQFNTTIYGLNDRYRGIYRERRVIMMNEEDMAERGFVKKQQVDLFNDHGGVRREAPAFLVVPYPIPRGCVATYFPEANPLVPIDSFAKKSLTPASKRVVITIEPSST